MVDASLSYGFTGQTLQLTISIPYGDKKCIKMPNSCLDCPSGYMSNCGRNIPFQQEDYKERPESCRLEQVDMRALIDEELKKLGV